MNTPPPTLLHLDDDGTFPNSRLPVLLWRGAIHNGTETVTAIEDRFRTSGWSGLWRNGIFPFHHYHSTAHEVLGIGRGHVRVMLGGPDGQQLDLETGDIVLLPAGTAHCNLGASADLIVVGAYPSGQRPDLLRGEPDERPTADHNIAAVPPPGRNPITGGRVPPGSWPQAI